MKLMGSCWKYILVFFLHIIDLDPDTHGILDTG